MKLLFVKKNLTYEVPDHKVTKEKLADWLEKGLVEIISADSKCLDLTPFAEEAGLDCYEDVKKCKTVEDALELIDEELGVHA